MRRWTRKKPTAGASTPTTAPAAKASRMNSDSNMDVRGVVPQPRQRGRRSVEDDAAADEDEPLDVALYRAELVRDVQDGNRQLPMEAVLYVSHEFGAIERYVERLVLVRGGIV